MLIFRKRKREMFDFRKELIEALRSKSCFTTTKKLAEDFLRETIQKIKETDDKEISKLSKITFICSDVSIIVCLSEKMSGIYSCTSYKKLTKQVFEEVRKMLKFQGLIIEGSETETYFSIMVP